MLQFRFLQVVMEARSSTAIAIRTVSVVIQVEKYR